MPFSFLAVAVKNLRRKPFRTGVLVFSIALLVAILIFAASFTVGVGASLKKAQDRLGADLIIVPVGARDNAEEFLLESKHTSFYMDQGILDRLRPIKGIEAVTAQTYLSTISGMCCDIIPTRIVAFDPATDFIVRPWLPRSLTRPLGPGEAIAGDGTAENLGLGLLEVQTTIFNNRFSILGVLEASGTGLDNALFMTEESLEAIIAGGKSPLRRGEISVIFAKLAPGIDPDYLGKVVESTINEVDVIARSDMGKRLLGILGDINKIFLVTVGLTALLTTFLVWAIFSAIANERGREIGIMRAIGARASQIVRLFLLEILVLGLAGSLLGAVAGTYLARLLAQVFTLIRNVSAQLSPLAQAAIALLGVAVGVAVCVVGAMLPINRLKKLEPLLVIKED
ncbi:MAG: FtsX-like permease family protein [Thermodesulfobacteriota bacterium]